ncbi:hypothetical protein [Pseudoalteromonas umbrosa]|uniref:hypothetical protein n=1 Tax=Pseudoalteromonas umbrosa TaxID=3048489 RepID=UPI0024C33B12|nr:hypothetical protein [Pseudoalteromonas sp. B95]MDK1286902.1 hypothetical protein [Pseudoalteromonas sp. B95]
MREFNMLIKDRLNVLTGSTLIVATFILAGCEGNQSSQSTGSEVQSVPKSSISNGIYNVMHDEQKFVMGACVELGYPLSISKSQASAEEQSACSRNLTHKFEADTKKSDTKLKWRVRVQGVELQCECAGYATQAGRN